MNKNKNKNRFLKTLKNTAMYLYIFNKMIKINFQTNTFHYKIEVY